MHTLNEDLARAQVAARVAGARELRAARAVVRGRRADRRAARAAQQARAALAREL